MYFPFFVILAFYYLVHILSYSFVVGGVRYFSLFDDMMISMRYARNLTNGYGFVWNAGGERVEGISNFLWTLYMAAVHVSGVSQNYASLVIQLSGMVLFFATLVLVAKNMVRVIGSGAFAVLAFLFTAFYYPLINWTIIMGTEVSLLAFLATLVFYLLVSRKSVYLITPFSYYWCFSSN